MRKNLFTKSLFIILLFVLTLTLAACSEAGKQAVLSQNVSEEVKTEEVEIQNDIELGNKYVDEGKFDEAKKAYEKAISLEPSNKETYVKIKDKYVEKQRLDDAYYVTKLAVNNNVDVDNMNASLKEIQNKFEVITIEKTLYQNNSYILQNTVSLKLNNLEDINNATIKWNNTNVDTSKAGTFTYDGVIEQYGRSVKLILNVLPIVKEKKIGIIKDVYESNGKRYVKVDEVEFYVGDKALQEGLKDKSDKVYFEDGKYHIYDSYYIRNKNPQLKVYEIADNATFNICVYHYNMPGNSAVTKPAPYSDFKKFALQTRVTWLYLENNVIVKTEEQYTP
ncbi:MAG: Ig-like domain-containing protein [Clostridiaceae bacterium]